MVGSSSWNVATAAAFLNVCCCCCCAELAAPHPPRPRAAGDITLGAAPIFGRRKVAGFRCPPNSSHPTLFAFRHNGHFGFGTVHCAQFDIRGGLFEAQKDVKDQPFFAETGNALKSLLTTTGSPKTSTSQSLPGARKKLPQVDDRSWRQSHLSGMRRAASLPLGGRRHLARVPAHAAGPTGSGTAPAVAAGAAGAAVGGAAVPRSAVPGGPRVELQGLLPRPQRGRGLRPALPPAGRERRLRRVVRGLRLPERHA